MKSPEMELPEMQSAKMNSPDKKKSKVKIFKRIYYPIMAVLVVVMLVLGFVASSVPGSGKSRGAGFISTVNEHINVIAENPHNSYNQLNQDSVRNYIVTELTDSTSIKRDRTETLDASGNNQANYYKNGNQVFATVNIQKATITQATMKQAGDDYDKTVVGKVVQNIVVAVPGAVTAAGGKGDAVLVMTHYDSSPLGGASDAVAVSAMIENAIDLAANANLSNDVVFLFSDAYYDGSYGAYAFMNQFVGFDNIVSRIKLVGNFDSGSNGGVVMLYQSGENNSKLIREYSKMSGGSFTSSVMEVISNLDNSTSDISATGDVASLDFKNIGSSSDYATSNDNVANLSKSFIQQQSDAMYNFYGHFGNVDLDSLDAKTDSVYFSYLNIATISYSSPVAYGLAALLLILLVAIIILNRKRKAFSWSKVGGGIFIQILSLIATALTLFVAYYLITLLMCAFGIITIHSLSSIILSNIGLIIAAMFFTVAIASAFQIIFKRTFLIKATDVVRGNTILWTVAAAILSFALPQLSYLFMIVAVLSLVVMLINVLVKDKFKAKFNMDIERLFLYVWPIVIALPVFIPLFVIVMSVMPALVLPILMCIFAAMATSILPYADYLKPVMDKFVNKLPKRTVRYKQTVTERVEDKAKKGKFTNVTSVKVVKEKIEWTYLNRVGIAIVSLISVVLMMVFSSTGISFSSANAGVPAYSQTIYDDSMLFVWEKTADGTESATVEVYDQIAYGYVNMGLSESKRNNFEWSADKKAYTKTYTGSVNSIIPEKPDFNKDGDAIRFSVYDSAYSFVKLTLNNAKNVKSIVFNKGDDNRESEVFTFTNKDTIVFELPYGYDDFTMTVDASCEIVFEQHVNNVNNLKGNNSDWDVLNKYYENNKYAGLDNLRSGVVLKITKTI